MKKRIKKIHLAKVLWSPLNKFNYVQYRQTCRILNQIGEDFDMYNLPLVIYKDKVNTDMEGLHTAVNSMHKIQVPNDAYYIYNLAEAFGYLQMYRTGEIRLFSERGIEMTAKGYAVAFCKRMADTESFMQMLPPDVLEDGEISLELGQYIEHMEEYYEM